MYDKDFAELVKIAAEKLKEDTVYKMLTRSEDYQKESDERDKAERNYEQLDLTMEQRKVCDVFLDYRDRQSLRPSLVTFNILSMFGSTSLARIFSARLAREATISVCISLGLVLILW